MEKKYKLRVLEMTSKPEEQLERESRENYKRFDQNIIPYEAEFNYLRVVEVELTQEEYDRVRHAVLGAKDN